MGMWKSRVMMDGMLGCKLKHYTTSWVCDLHLDYTFNCEIHMLLMTYGLLNSCWFTQIVAQDDDMTFNCKTSYFMN